MTQGNDGGLRELEPCPFCGDRLAHIWSPAQGGYSVICGNGCGGEGPVMENEERAAEAWNRRKASTASVPFKLPVRLDGRYIRDAADEYVCDIKLAEEDSDIIGHAIVAALNREGERHEQ